ncbi:tetratricopeptide repeat protein [Nodosilinea sp. LEGE 07298]|uniref:tetratricopeptide repeat protein n=1 Tax=Nodosilinea sp. LEGE 07298 TaxID=2777970 RepID=UPI0018826A72|nr:tetratricopeptide repeat protein [Nodosilinea sp. LEGE 07298]MBE9110174.1 tetratricopeptide repeat protein [Nodosilinea sp. LEGE 07298]
MDSPQPRPLPSLDLLIDAYEAAITGLEGITVDDAKTEVTHRLVIDALLARDAVERVRQDSEKSAVTPLIAGVYARLIKLDQRLKSKTDLIAAYGDLENARQSVNPNPLAWWWFLAPTPKAVKQHNQDRFDWVWNGLTVVFLVTATSFATSTAKAFSIQGFDVLGLFSSFIQGAGLAFVAGGAFTEKGQRVVQNALRSVNIPSHHHAEATCLLSASLMTLSFLGYSNLYRLGNLYYVWGQGERDRGDNISAFQTFQKVLDFAPNKKEAYSALGQVAEKMGRLDEAATYYEQGLALSDPASALGMARLVLLNTLKESGWATPIDNQTVREAKFFLELASQFNLGFDDAGNPIEVVDVVIDQQTHYGLLELAKIDFQSISPSPSIGTLTAEQKRSILKTQTHLKQALTYFQKAHWEESITLATYRPEDAKNLLELALQRPRRMHDLSASEMDLRLSEDEERLLSRAIAKVSDRLSLSPEFVELTQLLETFPYQERTYLIDRFIGSLPADHKKRLKEDLALDLGKPRCYIAIIFLIDFAIDDYLATGAKEKAKRLDLLQSRQQFSARECGNTEDMTEPATLSQSTSAPPLNRLDLYTLSIHEKSLISELLSVPEPLLSATEK